MHPHNDEEEKIFKQTTEFQTAWNNADAKALSEYFADDCLRVGAFGETQKGKAEVESAYSNLFKNDLPGSKTVLERGFIRFLNSELAVWQAPYQIFSPGANTLKGYIVAILRKQNDRWLMLEMHVKIFPFI